jgi:hypothetical protein
MWAEGARGKYLQNRCIAGGCCAFSSIYYDTYVIMALKICSLQIESNRHLQPKLHYSFHDSLILILNFQAISDEFSPICQSEVEYETDENNEVETIEGESCEGRKYMSVLC